MRLRNVSQKLDLAFEGSIAARTAVRGGIATRWCGPERVSIGGPLDEMSGRKSVPDERWNQPG